jgi:hypothetical protein
MTHITDCVGYVVAVAVVFATVAWHFSRSRSMLRHWARRHNCEILSSEYRVFWRGPFFWTASRVQAVYYVKLREVDGCERIGWVRLGNWFFGLLSDESSVHWVDV